MIDPVGVYEISGLSLEVSPQANGWKLRFAGVPEGYEPALKRLSPNAFAIERGPFGGARVEFDDADDGRIGPMPFRRMEGGYVEPVGYGLAPPPHEDDPTRDSAFAGLLARTPPGGRLVWDLPYPKHEFVRWAQGLDRFVFHSSTNADIDEFLPIRQSFEVVDPGDRGNLGAVYATHDGYWSMYFGVVDRERIRGSMRNGVSVWEASDGRTTTTYQFSLERGSLAARPFTSGAVYLLARDTFRRVPFYPGGPKSDEWVSEQSVKPIASLHIEPEDFPFLEEIAGHDESEFLEMLDLFGEILRAAAGYEFTEPATIEIDIDWTDDLVSTYRRWSDLADEHLGAVERRHERRDGRAILVMTGPEVYISKVGERLDELIE